MAETIILTLNLFFYIHMTYMTTITILLLIIMSFKLELIYLDASTIYENGSYYSNLKLTYTDTHDKNCN